MKERISKIIHNIYFVPITVAIVCFLSLLLLINLYQSQRQAEENLRM